MYANSNCLTFNLPTLLLNRCFSQRPIQEHYPPTIQPTSSSLTFKLRSPWNHLPTHLPTYLFYLPAVYSRGCAAKALPCADVQRAAADAQRDGASKQCLQTLAGLGAQGKFKGNIERDLHRILPKCMNVPCRPLEIEVPRYVKASGTAKVPLCMSCL